jgi:exodeoxyribonuclease VII large subunit
MQVYSLLELNTYLRRVVAMNFQAPLWITAEIGQAGQSRGHLYLDLIEKGEEEDLVAKSQAVVWATDLRRIRGTVGDTLDEVLQAGRQVQLQVRVDFHERYGLKLIVTDIDPAYTFGQISLQRRNTILALQQAGLTTLNKRLELPPVIQRIAVISGEHAAGLRDFRVHLQENAYGYTFRISLFEAAMQGNLTGQEITAQLESINDQAPHFDCIAIIRGGGARMDLAAFDGLPLCTAIAQAHLPVLTGIGHDIDETVADMVAHTNLKTPTAVADFFIQHNLDFETDLYETGRRLAQCAGQQIAKYQSKLEQLSAGLHHASKSMTNRQRIALAHIEAQLKPSADRILQQQSRWLLHAEALSLSFHPQRVLERGYSLTTCDGKILKTPAPAGTVVETRLANGTMKSTVV